MSSIEKEAMLFFDEGKAFPPGFRFHPTDEELVLYHLKGKSCHRRFKLDVIAETDVYKCEPEEFSGLSKLKTGDRQWFFFSPRDRKYPNAARSNRTTRQGYWKLTGKDRIIQCNSRAVGVKKTLVFYKGRSPNGERTDWVMHEYTMTEEEIKRCQSIKDQYALYKVFKKSGPGPKNGEQYGAPFREEDWEENNEVDVTVNANANANANANLNQIEASTSVCYHRVNADLQTLVDDFEEFMNKIADESVSVRSLAVEPNGEFSLDNGEASFDISQANTPYFNNEAPDITSTVKSHLEDLEEFIEMDDLFCPDFTVQNSDKPTQELENSQFDEFVDGLNEFDLYNDLQTLLGDGEVLDQGLFHQQDMNNLSNGVVTSNYNFEEAQSNIQQPYLFNGADTNVLRLSHDQRFNVYTPSDAQQDQTPSLATPGVVYDSSNSWKHQDNNEGKDSRISSSLWAFVESIPTTPASAAENGLVNRAFERMSSFSKLRLNYSNNSVVEAVDARKNRNSLLCFSLVGILCAILWMVVTGTTSK